MSKEVLLRFYVAMILYDLFKNKSFYDVAKFWDQPRGTIQTLYSQVASFATSILYFSKVRTTRRGRFSNVTLSFLAQLDIR